MKYSLRNAILSVLLLSGALADVAVKFDLGPLAPQRQLLKIACEDPALAELKKQLKWEGTADALCDAKDGKASITNGACIMEVTSGESEVKILFKSPAGTEELKLQKYDMDNLTGADFKTVTDIYMKPYIESCKAFVAGDKLKVAVGAAVKEALGITSADGKGSVKLLDESELSVEVAEAKAEGGNPDGYSVKISCSYFTVTKVVYPRADKDLKTALVDELRYHRNQASLIAAFHKSQSNELKTFAAKDFEGLANTVIDSLGMKDLLTNSCSEKNKQLIECVATFKPEDAVVYSDTAVFPARSMYNSPMANAVRIAAIREIVKYMSTKSADNVAKDLTDDIKGK